MKLKLLLATSLFITSISTFALMTDYSCNLKGSNLTANALISRGGFVSNEKYMLIVANNFGYELEVILQDRINKKQLIYNIQTLNSNDSSLNPQIINFNSEDNSLEINCIRADKIEYPAGY